MKRSIIFFLVFGVVIMGFVDIQASAKKPSRLLLEWLSKYLGLPLGNQLLYDLLTETGGGGIQSTTGKYKPKKVLCMLPQKRQGLKIVCEAGNEKYCHATLCAPWKLLSHPLL